MKKIKAILSVLLVVAIPVISSSTCIIVYNTGTEIIIGADSMRLLNALNTQTGKYSTMMDSTRCKIFKTGAFYFAISGFDDDLCVSKANEACLEAKTIDEVINKYADAYIPAITKNLEFIRERFPLKYNSSFQYKRVSEIVFFNFQNRKPQLFKIAFTLGNDLDKPTNIVAKAQDLSAPNKFAILGWQDHVTVQQIETKFKSTDKVKAIVDLLKIEDKFHPEVGGKLDVLRLNSNEEKWIYKKKNCNY